MRSLFGEGQHPNATTLQASLVANGMAQAAAAQATRLGRRFPEYRRAAALRPLAHRAYAEREASLDRPLSEDERLVARQEAAAREFEQRTGRAALDPVELESLGHGTARREAVAGYDLTFTPVKSVAALWGLGSETTRQQIFEAHEAAVADALRWLETNAALTRTGNRGQAQINTLGLIAAKFHHWDSRAGDPDLHTHVAISNKVQGPDKKWRSIDGRTLFAAAVSVSERYNTRIEDELRSRLGVAFEERAGSNETRRPVREIAGVPQSILDGFSKRRHGIEQQYREYLADFRERHGRDPSVASRHAMYQQATLNERPEKLHGRSLQQMITRWRQEAAGMLGSTDVTAEIERLALDRSSGGDQASITQLTDEVLAALTASRATWNVHHLRAEAHRQSRRFQVSNRDALIEAIVAEATDPRRSIRITTPRTLHEPEALRRADGESVFVEHGSALFTTRDILEAEERIVDAARAREGQQLDPATVQREIELSDRPLNAGQVAIVRAFCLSGRVVQLGLAPAGAGKTTAMRTAAAAWQGSGRSVVALAPSAVAADVLGEELGTSADTLAKFDYEQPAIAAGTMIVIDEAGMAGTLMLDRVIRHARNAGAIVRLLGDDQQLAAVEAGGVLRHIDHEVGAVRMHDVVRFIDPDEARATLEVREGIQAATDFYVSRGRVVAGTTSTMPDSAYAAWLADVGAERDTLLLATSTAAVADLNGRARADLILAGRVEVDGVPLRDGTAAGVGDWVATRRNARQLAVNSGRDWVKNGDGWRVLAAHVDGALTVEHRRHQGRVTLPPDYVEAHVELDYARTIRRAQGMTVDHAHLVVDPHLTREEFYVGISRARHGTRLYVAVMTDPGADHRPDMAGSAHDVLTDIISRTGTEPSASEAVRAAVASIGDLRRMAVEYEHALSVHVADHYRNAAESCHPGITADPAWPSVVQRLHLAEAAGWTPEDILHRAEQMGGHADAYSDTRVLVFRLDRLLEQAASHTNADDLPAEVPTWLAARPPADLYAPWDSYLPARYAELADRISGLSQEAENRVPTWTACIGNGPRRLEAMRQVVAYRAVYAVDSADPLGPQPDLPGRQRQAWHAASLAITVSQSSDCHNATGAEQLATVLSQDRPTAYEAGPEINRTSPGRHL